MHPNQLYSVDLDNLHRLFWSTIVQVTFRITIKCIKCHQVVRSYAYSSPIKNLANLLLSYRNFRYWSILKIEWSSLWRHDITHPSFKLCIQTQKEAGLLSPNFCGVCTSSLSQLILRGNIVKGTLPSDRFINIRSFLNVSAHPIPDMSTGA